MFEQCISYSVPLLASLKGGMKIVLVYGEGSLWLEIGPRAMELGREELRTREHEWAFSNEK